MMKVLLSIFTNNSFLPYKYCYLWKPELVWLNIVSDSLIALAYYSIPITLVYFVQKRRDLPYSGLFLLFSALIICCGTTHIMDVWILWHPIYWLAGFLKAFTAFVSVSTAILLVLVMSQALALPSPSQLAAANHKLEVEIIERKRIEEKLRESEERWHLAIKGNNDGIWDWNIKTNQTFRSPQFMKILGYEDHELGDDNDEWTTRIHPDDVDQVMAANQDYLERKISHYAVEHRLRCKDGTHTWVLSRGQAQWDDAGKPVRMVGSTSDITQRKQAEAVLHKLNTELEEQVKERTAQLQSANQLLLGQKQVLEMLATGASLTNVLNVLIQIIEKQSCEMLCSVLLLDAELR
jgi:PAS domain S-box-containing protein